MGDGIRNSGGLATKFAALLRPGGGLAVTAAAAAAAAADAENYQDSKDDTEKKSWQEAGDDRQDGEFFALSFFRDRGGFRGLWGGSTAGRAGRRRRWLWVVRRRGFGGTSGWLIGNTCDDG